MQPAPPFASVTIPDADADLPVEVDVVVVGGGIAGASALHHLAAEGLDVVLVDRGLVGGGVTAAAVGILSPPVRQPFHETVRHRGEEVANTIWRFALASIERLGAALDAAGASAEVELDLSGGWILAERHTDGEVRSSFEALLRAGFPVEWHDADAIRSHSGGRGFTGGFRLDGGGVIAPGPATRTLAAAAVARGARVREGVAVERVLHESPGHRCVTARGEIRCRTVVYATHTDSKAFSELLGNEIVPIRGQGLRARVSAGNPPRGSFATHWKSNVWRYSATGELLMSGWRHDAWDRSYRQVNPELDPDLQEDLEAWFRSAFPTIELEAVERWSGIFGWTADFLPLVGRLPGPGSEFVISGFSGGGLPFAFGCGALIADAVVGREGSPAAALLDPQRFTA